MTGLLERIARAHGICYWAGLPPKARQIRTPEGLTLNCIDWGGAGEPILFLHGGGLTAHSWDLVCLAMCEKYRCVAIDLRGHGDSARADRYTIDGDVDDVTAVIADFGWTKCHLVGMSLGGVVAAHYAAAAGSRASSLVLIDVAPGVDVEMTKPMRDFFDQPIGGMTVAQLVESAIAAGARGGYDKILYRYLHMTRLNSDGRLIWRFDPARRQDFDHILHKIQELTAAAAMLECGVLVVRGGRSRILSDDKASAFAACCRDGRWLTIPAAGHNVQEDEPMALAMALREFLSREARTSGHWRSSPYVRP